MLAGCEAAQLDMAMVCAYAYVSGNCGRSVRVLIVCCINEVLSPVGLGLLLHLFGWLAVLVCWLVCWFVRNAVLSCAGVI